MRRILLAGFGFAVVLLGDPRPAWAEPPPPLPMAGRVFPIYPLYPAAPGTAAIAYADETFVAADRTGYWLAAAPVVVWHTNGTWTKVAHPWAVAQATRVERPVAQVSTGIGHEDGTTAFWAGDYRRAREYLEAATTLPGHDARVWEYLALTYWALGDETAGTEAARYGAALAMVYPDENFGLLSALERVQGEPRRRLFRAAAEAATVPAAQAILDRGPPLSKSKGREQ